MGSLGELLVSSWGFCWMAGEEQSRVSLLWDRDMSSMRDHWKGRGGWRVLSNQVKVTSLSQGQEVAQKWVVGEQRFPSTFVYPATSTSPIQRSPFISPTHPGCFFLAAHQQHHWQPDHLWAPGILAVLPASPHCPSPVPWPMAAIIILFRDVSGDKKQTETNGQPSCGPVSEAEHLYIALPEQVCCRGSRRPWPTQTTEER